MIRLTEKHYAEKEGYYLKCSEEPTCPENCEKCDCLDEAIGRLGEYEDTGLTPEAVKQLKLASMGKAIAEITEFDGVPIERLRELAKADWFRRVVVLPRKVGDTVWILGRRLNGSACIRAAEFWWSDIPQVGKTVFLSREEAEKALEEEKDD